VAPDAAWTAKPSLSVATYAASPASGKPSSARRAVSSALHHQAAARALGVVAYLAGPDSAFVTGATVNVDGGYMS
jgi:3-oxoacyl-[acyl-carrier protein] reductase